MTESSGQQDVVDILAEDHHSVLEMIATIASQTKPAQLNPAQLNPAQRRDTGIAEFVRRSVGKEMYADPAMREHLAVGDTAVNQDIEECRELQETVTAPHAEMCRKMIGPSVGRVDELRDHLSSCST